MTEFNNSAFAVTATITSFILRCEGQRPEPRKMIEKTDV
jgi:hypothetical protein